MKRIALVAFVALAAVSCTSTKKVAYLQHLDQMSEQIVNEYEIFILPDDNLHITVSSLNQETAKIFNMTDYNRLPQSVEALNVNGYLVDREGDINFPVLGRVKLGGMTKAQATTYLRDRISEYIKEPTVNIRFLNFKVTVLGEVNRPGTYTIQNERLTLLEALGKAGDMTIYGKRSNVLIFREIDGLKTYAYLDVTNADILDSEFYYLQQNDVIYVQPNRAKAGTSNYNQNLSLGVSFLSLLTTIVALVVK